MTTTATNTTTTTKQYVLVLHLGELDATLADAAGQPAVRQRDVARYDDGTPMEQWRQAVLSRRSVALLWGRVNVGVGDYEVVSPAFEFGPANSIPPDLLRLPRVARAIAERYVRGWFAREFLASVSDADISAALIAGDLAAAMRRHEREWLLQYRDGDSPCGVTDRGLRSLRDNLTSAA